MFAERKVCLRCGQEGHTSSSCKRKFFDFLTNGDYDLAR
jgi:Zinc knuckle